MLPFHPFELARRQLELDRAATRRFPGLFARKKQKMLGSPHVLLRGSAPLFYELLAAAPELAAGPEDSGWIVGDMHLENIGAYKSDDQRVVFDINDFDDATLAPRRFDVLRLTTSLLLTARAHAVPALECVRLGRAALAAYALGAFGGAEAPPPELAAPMLALVERATRRTKKDLLDARAPELKGQRRFLRGERYAELPPELAALARTMVPRYVAALGERAPSRARSWRVEDVAQRIAGTGSVGRLRFALLIYDDESEPRVLDFKECAPPSHRAGGEPDPLSEASRVVRGARAMVVAPPKLMAPIVCPELGLSFLGRQLAPQEDKLDLLALGEPRLLRQVAERVAFMVGRAHARSAGPGPRPPWAEAELDGILDRALVLAGLFEAVYLVYARLA